MYENVNKAHPYIEKELEGIETYDRVILYGKAGRSMAIERPFVLDEPITTENMSEYEVKEIRPLLFELSKGGNKWIIGSVNFPRPDRGLRISKGNPPMWVHSEVDKTVISKPEDLLLTKSSGGRMEIRTEDRLVTIQVGYKFSTVLFWESRKLVLRVPLSTTYRLDRHQYLRRSAELRFGRVCDDPLPKTGSLLG